MQMTRTTKAAVFVTALALISIGSVPVTAVPADCTQDFEIPDGEPTLSRVLAVDASETGWTEATGTVTTTVEVKLVSGGSILRFGVFIDDGSCGSAGTKSLDCDDDNLLDTVNNQAPQSMTCDVDPGEVYYFHFVNDGSNILQYKTWV